MRQYAYEYGQSLMPNQGAFQVLFDALELDSLCNVTSPFDGKRSRFTPPPPRDDVLAQINPLTSSASQFYVDPVNGNDNNNGSLDFPFLTIVRAVEASRATDLKPSSIILRQGYHFITQTVNLTAEDSGLQFVNFEGEVRVLCWILVCMRRLVSWLVSLLLALVV